MLYFVIKLIVEDVDDRQYFVLCSCQCIVEIFFIVCQDRYYSVGEVVNDVFILFDFKFICVVEVNLDLFLLCVRVGDILKF